MNENLNLLFYPVVLNKLINEIREESSFWLSRNFFSNTIITYEPYYSIGKQDISLNRAQTQPLEAEAQQVKMKDINVTLVEIPTAREKILINFEKLAKESHLVFMQGSELLKEKMKLLKTRVLALKEFLCATALTNGKIELSETNFKFDFNRKNTHSFNSAIKWNQATAKILDDLKQGIDLIKKDAGIIPNKIILGGNVLNVFLSNQNIKELYDIRNYHIGEIQGEIEENYVGSIAVNGQILEIYTYSNFYKDEKGNVKQYIDPDSCYILNDNSFSFVSRVIPDYSNLISNFSSDLKVNENNIYIDSIPCFDPRGMYVMSAFSGLPVLNTDATVVIKTL